ncbi:DNA polymerase III subunit delta [Candidatus Nitronereus thalassa]|uniref:DNA polymerase III subunit delta n=1 Tax=Candidatus Nitronereus thalassa TaxID=3020898 RepID=A0ABU3KA39_9BACT|nr:DNA polymerase III subunit delta [Candidatus Nitronereus thalassa]MDT7043315.1 DNA polymerase III subunit delta [Candidatus Nitronereus thalassa]
MKPAELPSALKRHGLVALYLVIGEEDYFRDQTIATLRAWKKVDDPATKADESKNAGDDPDDVFACDILYGDETECQEILSLVEEVPFFSTHRLVILKWADKLSAKHGEALIPYFHAPNDSSTLVLSAPKLDGRTKWVQTLKSKATVIDCAPLFDTHCLGWVKQEAARLGLKVDQEAALLLKDIAAEGLYRARRELDKLALFVPTGQTVTGNDVVAVQGADTGASVFDLAGAIAAKNPSHALTIVEKNLEAGEAPLRILGALLWQYRRLWKAKDELARGGNESKVARSLGLPPFRQREFFTVVQRFSLSHFSKAWKVFAETDSFLKGGAAGSPHRVFHSLVFALCLGARD